jgi:hypothetical protein
MSLGKKLAERRQSNRKTIEVAEWAEDVPVMYVSALTAGDVDRIQRKHKDFINNPTVAGMVDLIIMKAEDKSGEKLFTLEDKPFLMGEPLNVISAVAEQMFNDVVDAEQAEKN